MCMSVWEGVNTIESSYGVPDYRPHGYTKVPQPAQGLLVSRRCPAPEYCVDYLVVGGGVVGLAIAQRLSQKFPSKSTYLVDRNPSAGQEISSRNSEVIHAGLYYPVESLKMRLCLRGRDLMYARCKDYNIPYNKIGKLVVAQQEQRAYIEGLHDKAAKLAWPTYTPASELNKPVLPTELLSGDQARELVPDLSKGIMAALWSPETGIVDSHAFMESLEKDIMESEMGELVYNTSVVRVDPYNASRQASGLEKEEGWVVQTSTAGDQDSDSGDAFLVRNLIVSAGLSGPFILNSLLPKEKRISMYYARGTYASFNGHGVGNIKHLVYPSPNMGTKKDGFHSLGTHLTLDLEGKIRFGPDLEWISPPENEDGVDFWQSHLAPSEVRLKEMQEAIQDYLPSVKLDGLAPDYVGVRPKLVGPNGGFQDFVIRKDFSGEGTRGPMVNLLGIESPGLTSSLAIAEYLVEEVLADHH
ncbi:pyridine nucleotide disulfide oxidoreductase-like protein [Athelia psychrophila]|uniref:L-2-hydroxyglutarate dehydrogenase, mitochondrial n=1 Tax=Athelia psychrophila TaxID=1759441 RepID=A0A166DWX1_9AGAM|nr:pyridine nucleotide disulfide oxidoreductase-like protein [Fibularhizoctonia sp. CBS 109695]